MRVWKKGMAVFITGVMLISLGAGCGRSGEADGEGTVEENLSPDGENGERSMGRYLECELASPTADKQNYTPNFYMEKQSDGKLALADQYFGVYLSANGGENFVQTPCPWEELAKDNYISYAALSPDGASAVMGTPHEEEGEEDAEETTAELTESNSYYNYYYIDKAGEVIPLSFPGGEEEFLMGFRFDRQGMLYGFGTDGVVYRFDRETGAAKALFSVEGIVEFASFTERCMAAVSTRGEIFLYDLEEEALAPGDEVLQDFLQENLEDGMETYGNSSPVIVTWGEQEDVLYLAFRGGLYRHVIGGTVMEQVIDGSITAFGDPSEGLVDMVMLPDNEFIVLYAGGKLRRYTYDPDVPTVPERQIDVYSLTENYAMRQAVSLFQKGHPDVYVRYEVGMSGGDGVTKEDAIRNLNTKMMAGEGPDILVLDGLPQRSYEEKGMLADISKIADGMSGEEALFPNVVQACKKDGRLYALPLRIQLPLVTGRKEDVAEITDLASLADTVEKIRAENEEGAILGLQSPEEFLAVLSLTSSGAWTDGDGKIDEKALAEFLGTAKRIWQVEVSGVEEGAQREEEHHSSDPSGEGDYDMTASDRALNIAIEEHRLGIGKVYRIDFDYNVITSLARRYEDLDYRFLNGQVKNGFIPYGLTGISANAAEDELAVEFYRFLFGRQLQDMDLSGGLPVNMASFDSLAVNPRGNPQGASEDDTVGAVSVSNDKGNRFYLELLWPSGEEFQVLREMAEGVTVMNVGDAVIEEAVFEVGQKMLKEDLTPQEAVREIVQKSAIYLAE